MGDLFISHPTPSLRNLFNKTKGSRALGGDNVRDSGGYNFQTPSREVNDAVSAYTQEHLSGERKPTRAKKAPTQSKTETMGRD